MAKYENLGYCPANAIFNYKGEVHPFWEIAQKKLGSRIEYLVYPNEKEINKDGAYIVEALKGANENGGSLPRDIASILEYMIPECNYPETEYKLQCHDVISPKEIPIMMHELKEFNGQWKLAISDKTFFDAQDDKFLLVVWDDFQNRTADIYIYRKR